MKKFSKKKLEKVAKMISDGNVSIVEEILEGTEDIRLAAANAKTINELINLYGNLAEKPGHAHIIFFEWEKRMLELAMCITNVDQALFVFSECPAGGESEKIATKKLMEFVS